MSNMVNADSPRRICLHWTDSRSLRCKNQCFQLQQYFLKLSGEGQFLKSSNLLWIDTSVKYSKMCAWVGEGRGRDARGFWVVWNGCMRAQSCLTFYSPKDCSPPGLSVCEIFRQECWSGLLYPPSGALPSPGIKPTSPALQAGSWPLCHRWLPLSSLRDTS